VYDFRSAVLCHLKDWWKFELDVFVSAVALLVPHASCTVAVESLHGYCGYDPVCLGILLSFHLCSLKVINDKLVELLN